MTTLREMIGWALEFDQLPHDESEPYYYGHWQEFNSHPSGQFDYECSKRLDRIRRLAARMHFGREAFYGCEASNGIRLWNGFHRAEWLLKTYSEFYPVDPCDAGDVIDWLTEKWDAQPATLFANLRQAFPGLDDLTLGHVLDDLDANLQERLHNIAMDNGTSKTTGIDLRADALRTACQTFDTGGEWPKDFKAHWAQQAAAGHPVAAWHVEYQKQIDAALSEG